MDRSPNKESRRPNRSKRLFLIIFISYMLVSFIPFTVMGMVWMRTDELVTQQAEDATKAIVSQIQFILDAQLTEIGQLHDQVLVSQSTKKLMYTSGSFGGENTLTAHHLIKEMSTYKNISGQVDVLFVYFDGIDMIFTDMTSAKPAMYYDVFVDKQLSYETFMQWLNSNHNVTGGDTYLVLPGKDGEKYLAFWRSLPLKENGSTLGNVGVLINEKKFTTILNVAQEGYEGAAFVINQEGQLLFASSRFQNLYREEKLPESSTLARMREVEVSGVTYMVKSLSSSRGNTFVTLLPRAQVFETVEFYRQVLVAFTVAALLLMLGLSVFLTYRSYRPLNSIMEQVKEEETEPAPQGKSRNTYAYIEAGVRRMSDRKKQLQDLAERSRHSLRASFLSHLLNNTYDRGRETFLSDCEGYGISLDQSHFCVVLVHVDEEGQNSADVDGAARRNVWYIISDIIESVADLEAIPITANYELNTLCMILNFPKAARQTMTNEVLSAARWIKDIVEREYMALATVGIGSIMEGYANIHQSYLDASHALEYRMVRGASAIIQYEDIAGNSQKDISYGYNAEIETRLEHAARAGNNEGVSEIITEIFDQNFGSRQISVILARCLLFDMVSAVIRLINVLDVPTEEIFCNEEPIEYLVNGKTMAETQERFKTVYRRLCNYINSKKRSHNDELRGDVEKFIQENANDENLSQQLIADQFGISANYLSGFFREQTGEKMSTYISAMRVQRVKSLLEDTQMSLKDVAAQTGFGSDLNLIRVFKKMVGETPGQYRKRMQEH